MEFVHHGDSGRQARFVARFKDVTGNTPADYLASWRVMSTKQLPKRGLQHKHVAYHVGYGSAGALTRTHL